MKKYFFTLILILVYISLVAFEPDVTMFKSRYQYELYQSWLLKAQLRSDVSATFNSDKIIKKFRDSQGREIQVEYDWYKYLITEQREVLPFRFPSSGELQPYLYYLESFIYRLNAADSVYLKDFYKSENIFLRYRGVINDEALNVLWHDFANNRAAVESVALSVDDDLLCFGINLSNDESLEVRLAGDVSIAEVVDQIKAAEVSKVKDVISQQESLPVTLPEISPVIKPEFDTKLPLADYIRKFYKDTQRRELLHNKINNVHAFLQEEFPYHSINRSGDNYFLNCNSFLDTFLGDINLKVVAGKDCINVYPVSDFKIEDKLLYLSKQEKIDLSELEQPEIDNIAPFLPQLVYEHRAIGSRLLNFLLVHDDVPTTLVLRTDKREKFEISSYANLLLLLSSYWQNDDVYFNLSEVKKVNGYVEFRGHLVANHLQDDFYDFAEVYFHLNKDYQIDLIMMILHPGMKVE